MREIVTYSVLSFLYVVFGLLTGIFYNFGNPTPYANAKSLLIALLWPLYWLGMFIYAFVHWVTRP